MMYKKTMTIATRESPLAYWQANWVKTQLENYHPGLVIHLLGLTTTADRMLDKSLMDVGGKGLFVKELEEALLDGRADIAVHSMKDVPMTLPPGLCIPVMCEREDPRDVFVSHEFASIEALPRGARLGTSSLRRQSQCIALRPDLTMANLRGNVQTRLASLDRHDYQGIILAAAGLKRLGMVERIRAYLSIEQMLPAAGQGVLGIECRENDEATHDCIAPLHHLATYQYVSAERVLCKRLGGGCRMPIAAYADTLRENVVLLRGLVAAPDGSTILRTERTGAISSLDDLANQAADDLLEQGADRLLT